MNICTDSKISFTLGFKNEIKEDKFIKVQGSVKHNEYKGLKQTFLQRIKLV